MRLVDMLPEKDGQIFLTGKKKSGKSTLSRQLITALPDNDIIIVIDSKHEWDVPRVGSYMLGNKRVQNLRFTNVRLVRSPGIYVYRSKYPHFYDVGVTRILLSAYKRQNVTIVIHEVYHFCHGSIPLPALGQAIAQGRAKNLRLFLEAQRPGNLPVMAYSDADIWVVFTLQNPDDRKKIADNAGFSELVIPVPDIHDFWVAIAGKAEPTLIKNTRENDEEWDIFKARKHVKSTS